MHGYFDHNATTPMDEAARAVWNETEARHWHNPSGLYREAGEARRVLEDEREALADLFDLDDPERLVFTSGATEANQAVIRHFAGTIEGKIALSAVEHPSVAAAVDANFPGDRIMRLPVDPATGAVPLESISAALATGEVGALSLMAANNETGAIQPWHEAADLCREVGVAFHCDAAQWFGKMPAGSLDGIGFVTGCGHKFGGGKGSGFLVRPEAGADHFHIAVGGAQENGRRAGTENLSGIAAMGQALRGREEKMSCQGGPRDAFEDRVVAEVGVRVLAKAGPRLWNTSMLVLPFGKNLKWLTRLSQRGFAVSTGSACSAGKGNPSAVMAAMGLDHEAMGRVLRISSGPETTEAEWEGLAAALAEIAAELGRELA